MTVFNKSLMSIINHEFIVYLADYRNDCDGKYVEAFFDFRTLKDWWFLREKGYEERNETVIHILNFYSSQRLRRNTYYRLNIDILRNRELLRFYEETPMLIDYTYDFRNENAHDVPHHGGKISKVTEDNYSYYQIKSLITCAIHPRYRIISVDEKRQQLWTSECKYHKILKG